MYAVLRAVEDVDAECGTRIVSGTTTVAAVLPVGTEVGAEVGEPVGAPVGMPVEPVVGDTEPPPPPPQAASKQMIAIEKKLRAVKLKRDPSAEK